MTLRSAHAMCADVDFGIDVEDDGRNEVALQD
jgi:hypothetical protein